MKFKKSELLEIIDSNGDLIGKNDVPTSGADLETAASKTTDNNAEIGTQPYKYDMMGRFGFALMPFSEGKENQSHTDLKLDLVNLMYERYKEILQYYYKHPNLLKPDYRKLSEKSDDPQQKEHYETADKIIKTIKKHFEKAFVEPKTIDEAAVVEDRVIEKRSEDEISTRSKDKEISDKKLEKIADLIDKLDKESKDKLKNLLESK